MALDFSNNEEYKLCIRHIPYDLYMALNTKMIKEKRFMHDIVRDILTKSLLSEEGSEEGYVHWQLSLPIELDQLISAWAENRGMTKEQQVIEDLLEAYGEEKK